MLRIAQLQHDLMAFQESQHTAREFRSAVQIVSRPPDQKSYSESTICRLLLRRRVTREVTDFPGTRRRQPCSSGLRTVD